MCPHISYYKLKCGWTINGVLQSVFSTVVDNDAYTFGRMLKQHNTNTFLEAMLVETTVHKEHNHWSTLLRKDMPAAAKTIMFIWFQEKANVWGSNQQIQGVPLRSWWIAELGCQLLGNVRSSSQLDVHLIHINSCKDSRPQHPSDWLCPHISTGKAERQHLYGNTTRYGHIWGPKTEQRSKYVLKSNSPLYGLKQSLANWYTMLSKLLKIWGFTPSKIDPCVFINDWKSNNSKGLDAQGVSSTSCKGSNAQGNSSTSKLGLRIQGKEIILGYVNN